MGAICVFSSSSHLSIYSLQYFFCFCDNVGLKHGKVLVPYTVSYFHDIRFQVDYVWTIRRPSFAYLEDKRRLKERQPGREGYHHVIYMCFHFKYIVSYIITSGF